MPSNTHLRNPPLPSPLLLLLLLLFVFAPSSSSTPPPTHIGIFAHGPISKGLFRDAETLIWALQSAPSLGRFLLPPAPAPTISV